MPTPSPTTTPADPPAESAPTVEASGPERISELLRAVDEAAATTGQGSPAQLAEAGAAQQKLVGWRLGIVSSLFVALRCKHPATADHSLRVAIGCSAWAGALKMPEKLRTQLEVAALLHDIGKIGVPDAILLKPGRLTDQELQLIDSSREASRHILRSAGMPAEVIDGVAAASAWFNGTHRSVTLTGDQTPFLSRMIAIVDAFDSMTTDQVYRPARSRERAIATLFEQGGTQFDPELVASYHESFAQDQRKLDEEIAQRWLSTLGADEPPLPWTPPAPATPQAGPAETTGSPFSARLIENMHDAVIFVDARNVVTDWNTGAERMTGVGASAAIGKKLTPELLDMAKPEGDLLEESDCLITRSISEGQQAIERLSILGRNGQRVSVETHIIPVGAPESPSQIIGASVLMRDVSDQTTLEERCQALRAEMTKDPMTQVANRREFDRMLAAFVEAHLDTDLRCSLIMADIDHFKHINDNFGHQAGDEAIMTFASLMKSLCRSGDLVARYGGEEFAILCADCNNATAAQRAEIIRKKLSETPHSYLGGKHITASFGVTELQPGDTPETLLRRSDRALLRAKDQGRNQVVQLGDGMQEPETTKGGWWDSLKRLVSPITRGGSLIEARLVTNVPIELAVDKLRGFIADRDAQILKTSENYLRLMTEVRGAGGNRRASDQPVDFIVDLELAQEHIERSNSSGLASGKYVQTNIDIKIQPRRDRDRRQSRIIDRARQLQSSLQSYLMAKEIDAEPALA
ncbi:putative diguanylate cyclase YdaM [Planctomycetes bacterium MalM25]|nr:putative diguanylate cyclase YdaM [Planctomycetes bacterium MalM25]